MTEQPTRLSPVTWLAVAGFFIVCALHWSDTAYLRHKNRMLKRKVLVTEFVADFRAFQTCHNLWRNIQRGAPAFLPEETLPHAARASVHAGERLFGSLVEAKKYDSRESLRSFSRTMMNPVLEVMDSSPRYEERAKALRAKLSKL